LIDVYFRDQKGYFLTGDSFLCVSTTLTINFKELFIMGQGQDGGRHFLGKNLSLNLETEGGFKWGISPVTHSDFVLGGLMGSLE